MSDEESDYESVNLEDSGGEDVSETDSETDSDSDDSVDLGPARQWRDIDQNSLPNAPPRFPFTAAVGVNVRPFDENNCVLESFEHFVSNDILLLICEETNRYANDYLRNHRRAKPFAELLPNELRVFLALVMLQGVIQKPDMKLFWSKNPLLMTPFFLQAMSHRRFKQIKQFLHFSNNNEYNPRTHPNPKLNKIWPILINLKEKFKSSVTPERDITVDESLLMFKGRLSWKQFIPLKRARFGIKSYLLCESKSGYVWDLSIYTGRSEGTENIGADLGIDNFLSLPKSSQIVLSLCKDLLGKGYCLTTDNFYSSPQLADILVSHKTDTYGTVKLCRKQIPKNMTKNEIKKQKLKKGDIVGCQRGKVTIMAWKDKKIVSLLSTVHTTKMVEVEKRGVISKRPECVISYNDTMGGVDRVDQHISCYSTPRKRGKKWYKKVFFNLIDISLWNAYVVYKKCGGTLSFLLYRIEIIQKTMEKYHSDAMKPKPGRPSQTLSPLRLTERHFLEYIPPTEKKVNPTRQCGMCSRVKDANGKKIRRESRFYCPDCNVALCVSPCFRVYHTVADI